MHREIYSVSDPDRLKNKTIAGRRRRERDDRLRGVHHGDDAHEQNGPGRAPLHRVPVLRQGQQRVTNTSFFGGF